MAVKMSTVQNTGKFPMECSISSPECEGGMSFPGGEVRTISMIIPFWERDHVDCATLARWATFPGVHEVLLVGTPSSRVPEHLSEISRIRFLCADHAGRGMQMNVGAAAASGDLLLFQHLDTQLTQEHVCALACIASDPTWTWGAFYRKFDMRHPGLRWLEQPERLHARWFGSLYGDQSIFIRRNTFLENQGFAEIPLMEDVEFSDRMRKHREPRLLDPPIASSPRRHLYHGPWKTTFRNLMMIARYRLGTSPHQLHAEYYAPSSQPPPESQPPNPTATQSPNSMTTSEPPKTTPQARWAARWQAFLRPLEGEKSRYLARRWDSLPEDLKTPNQISGRHLTHCGFTTGASYCSFHCTHCYLPKNANQIPIPSLEQAKEQILANRRLQGPCGGLQITGGDVADAYWRAGRVDELVEIIRFTKSTGLEPMLMTHGQTLMENPDFLERLVVDAGLRQMAVHIDMTQAGRHGFPINTITCEADLHPLRQQFTDLAHAIREKTGLPLELAHNCTVTRKNIDGVSEIVRWFLADAGRTHIWRLLSFQPEADTGRTLFSEQPITPADVWEEIQQGIGQPVRRDATLFGHPDCNSWAPVLVARPGGQLFPPLPEDPKWDFMMGRLLERIGGLHLMNDDAGTPLYRILGVLMQNPGLWLQLGRYLLHEWHSGRLPTAVALAALRGQAHTVGIGMHNFMDAAMVARADSDPVIKARLDACVFKGAVKIDGEWEAVPMCSMNQATWSRIYDERAADPTLQSQPQPWE